MIASSAAGSERTKWSYDDVAWEEDAMEEAEGFELETAAHPGFEDETTDDEIVRASEDLQADEG